MRIALSMVRVRRALTIRAIPIAAKMQIAHPIPASMIVMKYTSVSALSELKFSHFAAGGGGHPTERAVRFNVKYIVPSCRFPRPNNA